ncbi:MAG TPA: hypothetical protein VK129_08035 [Terriglobales bacterium]|nr:hypothetical protein [Terriglobales bacterium]
MMELPRWGNWHSRRWPLTGYGQPPGILLAGCSVAFILLVFSGLVHYHAVGGTVADVV